MTLNSHQDETPPTVRAADRTPPSLAPNPAFKGGCETGGLGASPATVPLQDLSSDKLITSALRTTFNEKQVPSLGGIPLLAKLGQGGMGAVYYGIHPRLQQEVAVKVLPFDLAEKNPDTIQRFFREAQLAASVKSPHLISVLDVNQESGLFYIVMEYVNGASGHGYLRQVLKTGAQGLHEAVALELCIAVCTGLAAAHAKGIIHRDVKPDNMMIPRDEQTKELFIQGAKLGDLGLARSEALERTTVTQFGACMGTPGYMSPEQASDARACGKPADVFSMGATLYALLTGRSPFAGSVLFKILKATIDDPHEPIRNVCSEISTPTAELIDRSLAKDPAARYVDAAALLAALKVCRAALGEPEQTVLAVERVSALLRAKEVGQPVHDSKQSLRLATPASGHAPAVSIPANVPKKSRKGLWAALLLVSAVMGLTGWYFGPRIFKAEKDGTFRVNADREQERKYQSALAEAKRLMVLFENDAASQEEAEKAVNAVLAIKGNDAEGTTLLEKLVPKKEIALVFGGVKMEFVLVLPGTFKMGSEQKPAHDVTITKAFYIGKYPVTVGQFRRFATSGYMTDAETGTGSGGFAKKGGITLQDKKYQFVEGAKWSEPGFSNIKQADDEPVILVSWNDAVKFCAWAKKIPQTHGIKDVRLPSEAEWEYTARGPKASIYPWGNVWDGSLCNHADQTLKRSGEGDESWRYSDDTDNYVFTNPVGKLKNASWCGAYDMVGNVWQWCEDNYTENYYDRNERIDPKGPPDGDTSIYKVGDEAYRVLRGGSWSSLRDESRSSHRRSNHPFSRDSGFGFRLVVVPVATKAP